MANPQVICQLDDGILAVPSFINLHLHLGEESFRGLKSTSLSEYLQRTEILNAMLDPSQKIQNWDSSAQCVLKHLKSWGYSHAATIRGYPEASDVKLIGLYPFMQSQKLNSFMEESDEFILNYISAHSAAELNGGLFFHSFSYTSSDVLRRISDLRKQNPQLWFSCHIAETTEDYEAALQQYGKGPVDVLADYGLLGERSLLVHGNYLNREDLSLLALTNTPLVLCPLSNTFLGLPTHSLELLDALGVSYCVGTDGSSTGAPLEPWAHLKAAGKILNISDPLRLLSLMTVHPRRIMQRAGISADHLQCINAYSCVADNVQDALTDLLSKKSCAPYGVSDMVEGELSSSFREIFKKEYPDWYFE